MPAANERVTELFCTAAELRGYQTQVTATNEVSVTGPTGTTVLHLGNLLRRVLAAPENDWPALVADHLGTFLAQAEIDNSDPLDAFDFTAVRALLRTRLYGDNFSNHVPSVRRTLTSGLDQLVVLDGVHTIHPVTYPQLATWPIDEHELFVLAENNTHADGPVQVERAEFTDNAPPWYLLAGEDYTSAHARWLDDYPVIGTAGALFSIPAERSLYAAPIEDLTILQAATILAQVTTNHYDHDPAPISQHLFHWYNGYIEPAVHIDHSGTGLHLYPTDDFQLVLNQLGR
ncbi:hypothetical protein K7711_27865 [Nocardia sp. CA2R105]|uniref:hypothetical protein n=1 Tax=Nocardia coffeae TaxID=2873381 RepID=UPI001CA68B6B|nr:hypothetical protein [Nocardia coffeae]MBY8860319.1 hypothetical protein [Nocardia coffeae]